jgi:F-type H+-transporting ATPase subunit gamma
MATEKQIYSQMISTKNIRKITASMKMVSAAKLRGEENRIKAAVPFNEWTTAICGAPQLAEGATYDELPQKTLIVAITSDKGLCGGCNSFVTKAVKLAAKTMTKQGKDFELVVVGDRGRSQLARVHADKIKRTLSFASSPGTFSLAAALKGELLTAGGTSEYDAIMIFYNTYVNKATYKQMYKIVKPFRGEGENEPMVQYEFEPETKSEILEDLNEYVLTCQLYHSFLDAACSEQSARMSAMENATKNAGELIQSLQLRYNRARQSRITTELIEIISGAAALTKKK